MYRETIRYTTQLGWLYWNGQHWEQSKNVVRQLVVDTLRQRKAIAMMAGNEQVAKRCGADANNINNTMALLEDHVTAQIGDFDQEDDFLPVLNGIIDLRTCKLLSHNPSHKFTYTASVEYDPEADYSEWESFLRSSVGGGDETVKFLQMYCGYMLTGHTREEKLLYINGPTRSGKGTFTETFQSLLPDPIAQEKTINTFTAKKDEDTNNFDLASLRPARMVFASESARYQSFNAAKVKVMTGGNQLTAAFKGKDSFRFKPKFKICITSNFEVNADVDDDAIWGRLVVIEFPNSHLNNEDMHLKERFQTVKAKQGVLRWAAEGAAKWYKQGRLAIPESIKKNAQEQRIILDTVSQWIDDWCHCG